MESGSVRIKLHSGQVRLIQEVRYLHALKRNLLSIGVLDKKGYVISAKNSTMRISPGSMTIMKGNKINGIYFLDGNIVTSTVSAIDIDKTKIWHLRLGDVSEKALQELGKHGLFGKDQVGKLDFCENCVLRKSTRLKFNTSSHTTTNVRKYVHSDL